MSPEHFTSNTVSAAFWCNKCGKSTQHRIDGHRKGPCLECMAKLEANHRNKAPETPKAKQETLFGSNEAKR